MVEAGAKEGMEEARLGAILVGHEHIKKLGAFQEEIVAAAGKAKRQIELYEIPAALNEEVRALVQERMVKAVQIHEKLERYDAIDALEAEMVEHYEAKEYESEKSKADVEIATIKTSADYKAAEQKVAEKIKARKAAKEAYDKAVADSTTQVDTQLDISAY